MVASAYSKQKHYLAESLAVFLLSLPGSKTLSNAAPLDICRFLAFKDQCGKSQVHAHSCPNLGLHGLKSCNCPRRLSYKTVDSYIGKLRSIFKDIGRDGDWNSSLALGNPVASSRVKRYLKAVATEQLQAAVTPKQATPNFFQQASRFVSAFRIQGDRPRRFACVPLSLCPGFGFLQDPLF